MLSMQFIELLTVVLPTSFIPAPLFHQIKQGDEFFGGIQTRPKPDAPDSYIHRFAWKGEKVRLCHSLQAFLRMENLTRFGASEAQLVKKIITRVDQALPQVDSSFTLYECDGWHVFVVSAWRDSLNGHYHYEVVLGSGNQALTIIMGVMSDMFGDRGLGASTAAIH